MRHLNKPILVMFFCLLLSCQNGKEGEVRKSFYDNGALKSIVFYNKDQAIDSSVYYKGNTVKKLLYNKTGDTVYARVYENNILKSEGFHSQNRKIKKWKYYHNGKLKNVFEYIDLCGTQYTNQGWAFDQNNKIINEKSNYYTISNLKTSYKTGEPVSFQIRYNPIVSGSKSVVLFSPMVEDRFCNVDNVVLDSVFSETNDFTVNLIFTQKTTGNLRGFIREFGYKDKEYVERELFFDVPLNIN